jgi:DNA-binding response OmpR family regulator
MHLNGWMSDDREKLLSAGCDSYIVKTIDPERIMSQIRYLTDETA